jgi:phosphonate transport system permease protein
VGLSVYFRFEPLLLITDFHYMVDLLAEMTPPNFEVLWTRQKIFSSVLQTLSMAFLGTIIGGGVAMGLAFFAARNTSPHPTVRFIIRTLLSVERVIPNLVIILVFLIAVGLGPFAGMLSIAVGTTGMFGKLFADAIEGADGDPVEAVYAVGANKLQVIRFSIVPQVLPSFIANLFYAFDVNLRAAIGLGVFGGAGIGFEIHMAMKLMRYRDALALIFFTIILICLFEKASDYLRKKAMGGGVLT